MSPLLLGNWKMNGRQQSIIDFFKAVQTEAEVFKKVGAVWLPPQPYLGLVYSLLKRQSFPLQLGAQSVSPFESGAYTGEISAGMLADLGIRFSLVGHSERRRHQREGLECIIPQVQQLLKASIQPIVCLSEGEGQGASLALQAAQILWAFPETQHALIRFAYEPLWAIGQKAATPDELAKTLSSTLATLSEQFKLTLSRSQWLYGGSVKADNALRLMQTGIGGLLVGQASLEAKSFLAIAQTMVGPKGSENSQDNHQISQIELK